MIDKYQEAAEMLKTTNIPYSEIAEHLDVSVSWLAKFKAMNIDDPGIYRTEALYNYLLDDKRARLKRIRKAKK